jgi:transposase-like protein
MRNAEPSAEPAHGVVKCPFCDSADVKVESPFGGSVSEMLFRCAGCRSFFHWVKLQPDA